MGQQLKGLFKRETTTQRPVRRLSEHISRSNRNTMIDNWFSSVELAESFVGTIRKNKMGIDGQHHTDLFVYSQY